MKANKNVGLALTTTLGILSAASLGYAQRFPERLDEMPKPPAPIEKPPAGPEVPGFSEHTSGEVLSADPIARMLVIVTDDQKQMTFFVPRAATVELAELKPGDSVTVRFIAGGGRFIAQTVTRG